MRFSAGTDGKNLKIQEPNLKEPSNFKRQTPIYAIALVMPKSGGGGKR
jgi:hypothetical protein